MIIADLYDAIFNPEKLVQFRSNPVNENGDSIDHGKYSEWKTITKDSDLTAFIGGCLPSGSKIFMADNTIRITDAENHDGTIVDLHGRKYLLTEIKTNFNGEEK